MSGARADGTFTREQRIEAIRLVKCDGWPVGRVSERLGPTGPKPSTIFAWMRNPVEVAEAVAAGPMDVGEAPPRRAHAAAAAAAQPAYTLPPIGEEDPEAPSADFMATIAEHWAMLQNATSCDHLAGWPEGTVQGWFDRARTDRGCAIRVAQLRRAEAVVMGTAARSLLKSGNTVAITKMLTAAGFLQEKPADDTNGAEGTPLDAIKADLRARLVEAK